MNKIVWLKMFGWAAIIHVLLIAITVAEVFIFSQFYEPGRDEQFYQYHARTIAPYIAIIMGFILVFAVAKKLTQKIQNKWTGILLAITYIIIDIVILQISSVNWSEHYLVFLISFFTKLLAGYIGALDLKKYSYNDD